MPIRSEAVPVPADHGCRPDHCNSVQNPWAQPVQQDKDQAVPPRQARSPTGLPAQYVDLMAEHQDFGLEPNPRFEANSDRIQNNVITSDHQDRSLEAIRSHAMQDEVFSRDRRQGSV